MHKIEKTTSELIANHGLWTFQILEWSIFILDCCSKIMNISYVQAYLIVQTSVACGKNVRERYEAFS